MTGLFKCGILSCWLPELLAAFILPSDEPAALVGMGESCTVCLYGSCICCPVYPSAVYYGIVFWPYWQTFSCSPSLPWSFGVPAYPIDYLSSKHVLFPTDSEVEVWHLAFASFQLDHELWVGNFRDLLTCQ